jgi:riboflavin kinase/FMN adenylyltransferase
MIHWESWLQGVQGSEGIMLIIRGLDAYQEKFRNVVLTIGNFDGVHIGHQKIFRKVVERARALRGTAMAVTFEPHPLKVIAPERGVRIMTPFPEKARLMQSYGIGVIVCIPFTREFANTTPDDFIRKVIVDTIGAREVIVGHSYAFGKGKKGSTGLLRRKSRRCGFTFRVIRYAKLHGEVVSSSRIRSLLSRGRVCEASWLLGRPYMIEGTVIPGAGRGGKILNIPTANIRTSRELIPREGVYVVKVGRGRELLNGAANIGRNPTFGENQMSFEVHLFDFSDDIVGEEIKVYFIDRIRDERKFPDSSSLHDQILRDIEHSREILKTKKYPPLR